MLPARRGNLRKIQICMGILQFGLCLLQLLIKLRCLDFRKQVSLMNASADIEIPLFQIAAGACVDGRVGKCLRIAGQRDFFSSRTSFWVNNSYCWRSRLLCGASEYGLSFHARMDARTDQNAESQTSDCGHDP